MKIEPILFDTISGYLSKLDFEGIPAGRKALIEPLVRYGSLRVTMGLPFRLQFICTHNSRRSQFGQAWAAALGHHFGMKVEAFSGGTEVTAFHPNAVSALKRAGFTIASVGSDNVGYAVSFSDNHPHIRFFSKLFSNAINPDSGFAAVMTCTDADAGCPFVPRADVRIALPFDDPKVADGTENEPAAYDTTCKLIATELSYLFHQISNQAL